MEAGVRRSRQRRSSRGVERPMIPVRCRRSRSRNRMGAATEAYMRAKALMPP